MSQVHVSGISKNAVKSDIKKAIQEILLKSTNNLAFLKQGDLVLLKPALNSPDPYPATTNPLALEAVAELLTERGARVVAGDQSGMEHVVLLADRKEGSSLDCYNKSGMGKSGVEFKALEDDGFEQGYRHFTDSQAKSWPKGFYVSKWIDKADHIISLPRISTHSMAGVTLGLKNMVGILRDDSRLEFHADGPYKWIFGSSKLKVNHPNTHKFIERMVEINLAVQDKLRATLFLATEAQTTFGPDKKAVGIFKTHKVRPEEGLVFASADMVSADLFALAFLTYLYRAKTSLPVKLLEKFSLLEAMKYHKLGKENPRANRFIKYGSEIGLGNIDVDMKYENVSEDLKKRIEKIIN